MSIPYTLDVLTFGYPISIDGDGDVNIHVEGGYYGDVVVAIFNPAELQTIATIASVHKQAYQVFRDNDFSSDEDYLHVVRLTAGVTLEYFAAQHPALEAE